MDSPVPLDEGLRSLDTAAGRAAGGKASEVANAPPATRVRSRKLPSVRALRPRITVLAAALLGTAFLGLLIYAAARGGGNGEAGITTKIPDAATIGAVVKNLPPPNLLKPVSPEEAVKDNADRPFVERPDTPASRFVLKTGSEDRERALTCLTQAVYYEAASEGSDGGRAVAQVVINRVRHPGYPASVCGVVYQGSDRLSGCQFTFTCDGSLLRPQVASLWTRSRKIAQDALAGHVFAPIGHATHYHADYVLPYWADSLDKTVQIGQHIFYRLRGSVGDGRSFFQRYAGVEPPIPEPRPAIVAVQANDGEQQALASAPIGNDPKVVADGVEKIALTASPLLADAAHPTLMIDEQAPQISSRRAKRSSGCSTNNDLKKLAPLPATNLRAGSTSFGC